MKKIRYGAEALLIRFLFGLFKMLGPEKASAFGGWIGRILGPRMAVSRKATRHLNMCMPELSPQEQQKVIASMWDNLGRVVAEYPHLEILARDYTTITGTDIAESLRNKAVLYFGGHTGNWEIYGAGALVQLGIQVHLTYREPNNPWTADLLDDARSLHGKIQTSPKGRESGRSILKTLKNDETLGILIDQKYNEGVESLFFGKPAMTNPVFVELAQRYKCPLVPIRCVREKGCHFHFIIYPEIPVFHEDGTPRLVPDVIADAHTLLEGWIREHPDQWIWLHRRWKS